MKRNSVLFFLSLCLLGSLWLLGFGLTASRTSSHHRDSIAALVSVSQPSATSPPVAAASSSPQKHLTEKLPEAKPAAKASARVIPPFPEAGSWDEIRDWVMSNPAEASAWLTTAPAGTMRDDVAELVCLQQAQSDPPQALALAEQFGGSHKTNILENVTQQWAEQDESAAYQWAAGQPPGDERDRLLGRIALVQSKSAPDLAARMVAQQISPGAVQDEAAISVLYQWAAIDRNAALAWAESFPAGNLRDRAIREVEGAADAAAGNRLPL